MKNKTKHLLLVLGITTTLSVATFAGSEEMKPVDPATVARGKALANIGGCHDCHTPKHWTEQGPVPDETRALSGHQASVKIPEFPGAILGMDKWIAAGNPDFTAWAGPWGISFAANLTPDMKTGLGSWTEDMFLKAMKTGKHMGAGRPILPPMPWQNLSMASEEDLKAIFAYLRTIKPIENAVPDPIAPPPIPSH